MNDRERRERYMAADPEMYRGESADDPELIRAIATISALEKRIGKLEAERDEFRDGFELAHARISELESELEELERELDK